MKKVFSFLLLLLAALSFSSLKIAAMDLPKFELRLSDELNLSDKDSSEISSSESSTDSCKTDYSDEEYQETLEANSSDMNPQLLINHESSELSVIESAQHIYLTTSQEIRNFIASQKVSSLQAQNFLNRSLLTLCAHVGKIELEKIKIAAQVLIEAGAHVNAFIIDVSGLNFARGLSPFYVAILTGSCELVDFLLQKGARVERANRWGHTPLMAATFIAQREDNQILPMLQILIAHGARVNASSTKKESALGFACRVHAQQSIFYLIAHGASISKLTKQHEDLIKNCIPSVLERIALIGKVNLLKVATNIPEELLTSRALFYAATQGHANLLKVFLDYVEQNILLNTQKYLDLIQEALNQVEHIISSQSPYFSRQEQKSYTSTVELLQNFLAKYPELTENTTTTSSNFESDLMSWTNYSPFTFLPSTTPPF